MAVGFTQNPVDSGGMYVFSEDSPFEFNQSTKQAFYFVHFAEIIETGNGDSLELAPDDWIGVFCNEICVGGKQWDGEWTEVPAMGFDEFPWTDGYCQTGDFPTFQFYDTSEDDYYPAFPTEIVPAFGGEYEGWQNNTFFNMELLFTELDCNDIPFGPAFLDDCGQCVGDGTNESTDINDPPEGWAGNCHYYDNGSGECNENWAMDCGGLCFGEADYDECGLCCGGGTGQVCSYYFDESDFGGAYDCNGDCSGSAEFDECGACCDGLTGAECSYYIDESDFGGVYDCVGVCNGEAIIDDCGICAGGTTNLQTNNVESCEGPDLDCNCECCFGTPLDIPGCGALEDDCNVCSGGNSGHENNSDIDCNGDCFGDAYIDNCGVCVGGNTGNEECLDDCNGDIGGSAYIDDCGECVGGNTGMIENWAMDCNAVCFGGALIDDCSVCSGGDTGLEINDTALCEGPDVGCDCVCYSGAFLDDCSECSGGTTGHEENSDMDACGNCYGDCIDIDGFVTCGDDSDNLSISDCTGVCDGTAFLDDCAVCSGGISGHEENSDKDACGICFGDNTADDTGFVSGPDADCAGVCFGEAFLDLCEVCSGGTTGHIAESDRDPCGVCFGENTADDDGFVTGPEADCTGLCYGEAYLDDCGVCSGGYSGHEENADLDCEGICFGEAVIDWCNVCSGGTTGNEYNENLDDCNICFGDNVEIEEGFIIGSNADCAGVCFGAAYLDDCDVCSEGTSGHLPNSDKDACGVCFGENYESIEDFIVGPDADCTGICFGAAFFDECGICSEGTTGHTANIDQDCFGTCYGDADFDHCEVCSGGDSGVDPGADDQGCGCFELPPTIFYFDADDDGLGYGAAFEHCPNAVPEGWVDNDDDLEPYCATNDTDECGVCAGENADQDCLGVCFGEAVYDECGVCDGDNSTCNSPIANNQDVSTFEDIPLSFGLDVTDPTDDPLTVELTLEPNHGVVSFDGITATYTPIENFSGFDNFYYIAFDGLFYSEPTKVDIEIIEINDSPVSVSIDITTQEDEEIAITLVGSDIESDDMDFEITEYPEHGELSDILRALGIVEYMPNDNYYGYDQFSYRVTDGELYSTNSVVTLEVTPVNDPPFVTPEWFITPEDTPLSFAVDFGDIDGDNIDLQIIDGPFNGMLEISDTIFIYTPNENYVGQDEVIFQAVESSTPDSFTSSPAGITIVITEVNDAPVAYSAEYLLNEDDSLSIELIGTDPEDHALTFSVVDDPLFGNLSGTPPYITYTPNENYDGADLFTYHIEDELSLFSNPATITVTMNPVNDAPLSNPSEFTGVDPTGFDFDLSPFFSDIDDIELEIDFIPESETGDGAAFLGGTITSFRDYTFRYVNDDPQEYDYILYKVKDDVSESGSNIISFEIPGGREVSERSTTTAVTQNVNVTEETPTDISMIGFDIISPFPLNGEGVNFSITSFPDAGDFDTTNINLDISQDQGIEGAIADFSSSFIGTGIGVGRDLTAEDQISYQIYNPTSGEWSNTGDVNITIFGVNDPPEITPISNQTMDEDGDLLIPLEFYDPDSWLLSEYITFTATDMENFVFSVDTPGDTINSADLLVIPVEDYSGTVNVTVQLTDGIIASPVTEEFNVTVNPVNDAPVMVPISNVVMTEGETASIIVNANDVDGDEDITFTAEILDNPDLLAVEILNDTITFIPSSDAYGSSTISIFASDGMDTSTPITFDVNVQNVNDAPVVDAIADPLPVLEDDGPVVVQFTPEDVDGDDLLVTTLTLNTDIIPAGNIEVIPADAPSGVERTMYIQPGENAFGTGSVIILITDGLSPAVNKQIQVTVESVNDAPNIIDPGVISFEEDKEILYVLQASDIEGDSVVYNISSGENIHTDISDNIVLFTAEENFNGTEELMITVSDGIDENTLPITVEVLQVNDPPDIISTAPEIAIEDSLYSYQILVTDIDSDEFYYTLENNPEDMNISETGLITWIPREGVVDSDMFITVTVTDGLTGDYLMDFEDFSVIVLQVNDPPVIISTPPFTAIEDVEFSYQVVVEDPDDLDFIFNLENEPAGMSINTTGSITWTPTEGIITSGVITLNVTDRIEDGLSDEQEFVILVTPVNDAPVITSTPGLSATEDLQYSYQIMATDPDDSEFTFELLNYPDSMDVTDSGLITWTPLEGILTSGTVTIAVGDGGEDGVEPVLQEFEISVTPVNDPPIITSEAVTTATEDILYEYQLVIEDPDDNEYTFTIFDEPLGMLISNTGIITWTPIEGILTSGMVLVQVSDGGEDLAPPASQQFEINVTPVNDPPVIISVPPTLAVEETEYSYQIQVSDPDDEEFNFTLTYAPEDMTISETGLISWTPAEGVLSSDTVLVSVEDGGEDEAEPGQQSFVITVTPVNDPPIVQEIPIEILSAFEDIEWMYQLLVEDPDDTTFTFTMTNAPEDMEISISGLISWLPLEGILTSGLVTVTVADGLENDVEPAVIEFEILVIPINDPPVIQEIPLEILTALEDIEWTYQLIVDDPDDDNWEFTLLTGPESMVLSDVGNISWTPLGNDGLEEDWELTSGLVSIEVADGGEDNVSPDTTQFEIIVDEVNDPPMIISDHISEAETGIEWNYSIELTDPDDDTFYFELHDEPNDMTINPFGSTGLISWTPQFETDTLINFVLFAYDGPEEELEFRRVARDSIDISVTVVFMAQQSYTLREGGNLMSFYGLPYDGDNSIENVLEDLDLIAYKMIGEGVAASRIGPDHWVGSLALEGLTQMSGYWLFLDIPSNSYHTFTTPLSYPLAPNFEYKIHNGKNLISYIGYDTSSVSHAIPDDAEPYFHNIISVNAEGLSIAASNLNNCGDDFEGPGYCQWVGSLAEEGLIRKKGYWVELAENTPLIDDEWFFFSWVTEPPPEEFISVGTTTPPEEFSFGQSTEQAFYFMENAAIHGEELEIGDWIIAYCGENVIVGSREWTGSYTDVPAMGDDSFENTSDYCQIGEIPVFRAYISKTGQFFDMTAENIQPWGTNEVFFITSLTNVVELPKSFSLGQPYPNPFNPVATIHFELPMDHPVSLNVYDLLGRKVSELVDSELTAGYHTIHWNAVNTASGVYFVKMTAGDFTQTQKVVLLK